MKLHPGFSMGPKSNDRCLYKRMAEGDWRHTAQRGGHVQEEAEVGVMPPQAGEHQGPQRGGRGTCPEALGENSALLIRLGHLASGTVGE